MKPLAACCAIGIVLLSCATQSRAPSESELYLLRARGADAIPPTTDRALLRVAPVGVAAHVRGIAIVTDDGRVRTLVNQRFAAPIPALVEDAVTDRLRASGRFGAVLPPGHPSDAPFVLRLVLRAFEIVVTDSGYVARVTFDGLIERDRAVIRSFRASADRVADGPDRGGFVRGLEDALNGAIDIILQELETAGIGGIADLLPQASDSSPDEGG
jgi:ABC-type uncharacterized transport system auxiliary subunit